jgi:flagellar FliJ protein
MAKFDFQLEGVLRHRERVEHERQRDCAVAQAQRTKAHDALKNLDERVQLAAKDLRDNHLIGEIDLSFLAAHRRFMQAMQRQGLALMQEYQLAGKKVAVAQAALAEAAKQRKILEKLRERQKTRWALALAKKELEQLDEVAMQMTYQAGEVEREAIQ